MRSSKAVTRVIKEGPQKTQHVKLVTSWCLCWAEEMVIGRRPSLSSSEAAASTDECGTWVGWLVGWLVGKLVGWLVGCNSSDHWIIPR